MTKRGNGSIPIVERYRGVGIHDGQSRNRIDSIVKFEIDEVMAAGENIGWLFSYCGNVTKPPEARLLAGAMLESIFEIAVGERRERPDIDLVIVRARTAGLDSEYWRSRTHYGTIIDVPTPPGNLGAAPREHPLDDET